MEMLSASEGRCSLSDTPHLSKPFQRFLQAFFDPWTYEMWHEGFDVQSLSYLSAQEQRLAEDLLLQPLEQGNTDSPIIVGLGELRSQQAIPALSAYLQASCGDRSVIEPALALWQIAHCQQAAEDPLLDMLPKLQTTTVTFMMADAYWHYKFLLYDSAG